MSSWLMKAEPDTRLVNGHDVRFSVEDWEREGVSSWEGVRSHEAKKILSVRPSSLSSPFVSPWGR